MNEKRKSAGRTGEEVHPLVMDVTVGELRRVLAHHPDHARLYVVTYDEEDDMGEPLLTSGTVNEPIALCTFRDGIAILCDFAWGERLEADKRAG